MTNDTNSTFTSYVDMFKGRKVECGDHCWMPWDGSVVRYTYRGEDKGLVDLLEAATAAGRIINNHAEAALVWG